MPPNAGNVPFALADRHSFGGGPTADPADLPLVTMAQEKDTVLRQQSIEVLQRRIVDRWLGADVHGVGP